MDEQTCYRVNAPTVVDETIDGETVIIHLETGRYYSAAGVGSVIWESIRRRQRVNQIVGFIHERYDGPLDSIRGDVARFVQRLIEERLVSPASGPESGCEAADGAPGPAARSAPRSSYEPPNLIVFDDMQELLQVDPIHEVDEAGWPTNRSD